VEAFERWLVYHPNERQEFGTPHAGIRAIIEALDEA
jgi:hypothetical protein